MMNELFFELIRISIGNQDSLTHLPNDSEWNVVYKLSEKQSLAGICFAGLQRLGAGAEEGFAKIGMSEIQYFTWMCSAAQIQQRNELMNNKTNEALDYFRKKGFPCQVLKGQGIAKLYTSANDERARDLISLRQSGDVDVWIRCKCEELYELSMKEFGKIYGITYHHIHYPLYEDCEIEAHIYPSFLHNFIKNKKLHYFFELYKPKIECGDTPSISFNRVYILLHIYNHFCGHGVGMRQLMDYYFVLCQGFTVEEKKEALSWIKTFGMLRFTKAVMWVLGYVFGMNDIFFLTECNEKDGRFLLMEIMTMGNMGHWDKRVNHDKFGNAFGRFCQNFRRDFHVVSICPDSALCEPFWGIYQFLKVKRIKLHYNK